MKLHSALLYIDPGTGAMLLTTLLGFVATLSFATRKWFVKIRFWITGGRSRKETEEVKVPIVIFSDHKRYWGMFKPVCDVLERKQICCKYLTASSDDPALKEQYTYIDCSYIGEGNRPYVRLNSMNTYVCLATTPGLGVYQWKRAKNVDWYVHVIHGIGDARGYKMFGLDEFDAVLLAGNHQVDQLRKLEEKRGGKKNRDLLVVGESHMDFLMDKRKTFARDDYEGRTVLLAPSWGTSSILVKYGNKIMDALISTGYRIIIRPHPQSLTSDKKIIDRLKAKYPENDKLVWDYDNDNFKSLNRADIMVSDFSSVIWDYTFVFDKPIIYADVSFDSATYDLAWVDEDRWDMLALAKVGTVLHEEDLSDIKALIDNAIKSDDLKEKRNELRKEIWGYPGESARRIAEYVVEKYNELKETTDTI